MDLNAHKTDFHTDNEKRQILIVDDEINNREILAEILKQNYDILQAVNGVEALNLIRSHQETLSLILLDLFMPQMDGKEVLSRVRENVDFAHIPVIVFTSDQQSEAECLSLGAIDFIPKPYPQPNVILARVRRTIELFEDRRIIQVTERDTLTGLYTKEYFFRYAEQFDRRHKGMNTDAILIDVNHFHLINERFGKTFGDEILRHVGDKIRESVWNSGGIVSRKEADTFLIYCPHRDDYSSMLEKISEELSGEDDSGIRIYLRMGVYADTDKSIDIEQRFDRAKIAADSVHGNYTNNIGIYDDVLNQKALFAEQLVEEFPAALENNQFQVYFQPKFDIRPNKPVITSAEALVRWVHPKLGMINPGVFIPLFEENGLIRKVDHFVWRETARKIREWKDRYDFHVPVSVNVSRLDLYDPNISGILKDIIEENGLTTNDLLLEITESAYTQDSGQIIDVVKKLRDDGFRIEMDDFGSGYSSLNMISSLPIDALKLDMQFIRNAFAEGGSMRMIEVIIDIAGFLGVPSIAEGVETEEQMKALRMMGCDIVQGFYFSKPVPAEEFEHFLSEGKIARAELDAALKDEKKIAEEKMAAEVAAMRDPEKESSVFELENTSVKTESEKGIPMRAFNIILAVLAVLISIGMFVVDRFVDRGYRASVDASERLLLAQQSAFTMENVSDYLTDRVRSFVVNGDVRLMEDFFKEVEQTRRRDQALNVLNDLLDGHDNSAYESLSAALELSNELIEREYHAMRLRLEADGYKSSEIPPLLSGVSLSEKELSLSAVEQTNLAAGMLFDDVYLGYKDKIKENVRLCTESLLEQSRNEFEMASVRMVRLLRIQSVLTVLLLAVVFAIIFFIRNQIRKPLSDLVENIRAHQPDKPKGAAELRFVSLTYNDFLADSQKLQAELSFESFHDQLTGIFNKRAYDLMVRSVDTNHVALLLFDVDQFKKFNDTYGYNVGDLVLKRIASLLKKHFRSVDIVCRIGGDEFVVIMTRMNSSMRYLVENKFLQINKELQTPNGEIPEVSVSLGAAFSDRRDPQGDLLEDAEAALKKAKSTGRRSCEIY